MFYIYILVSFVLYALYCFVQFSDGNLGYPLVDPSVLKLQAVARCYVVLELQTILPRFEDVAHPLRFRLKLSLLQYEEVTFSSNNLLPHCEVCYMELCLWLRIRLFQICLLGYGVSLQKGVLSPMSL